MLVRNSNEEVENNNTFKLAINAIEKELNSIPSFHREYLTEKIADLTYLKEMLGKEMKGERCRF